MFLDFLLFFFECGVTLFLVVAMFFAFLYYCTTFVEERMNSTIKFLKFVTILNVGISILMFFSRFPMKIALMSLIENGMFVSVIFRGFPFINLARLDFLIGIGCTVFSHVSYMLYFLMDESHDSLIIMISYFILMIWFIPVIVITSISALEEPPEGSPDSTPAKDDSSKPQSHSSLKLFILRLLRKAEDVLPHSGDKFD